MAHGLACTAGKLKKLTAGHPSGSSSGSSGGAGMGGGSSATGSGGAPISGY
jgi:hypothetical protein